MHVIRTVRAFSLVPRPKLSGVVVVWAQDQTGYKLLFNFVGILISEIQCIPKKIVEITHGHTVCVHVVAHQLPTDNSATKQPQNKAAALSSISLLFSAKSSVWKC